MSSDSPASSLSGVLVVLNIVFALVWFPIFDAIDDSTQLFRAVFLVNLWATGWWIWTNTSLRGRVQSLPENALAIARLPGPILISILHAFHRLFTISVQPIRRTGLAIFAVLRRRSGRESRASPGLSMAQIRALRLAWLISSSYEQARRNHLSSSASSIDERAEKRHNIRALLYSVLSRRMGQKAELKRALTLAAPPANRCDIAVTLVCEDRSTPTVPPMQTMISFPSSGENELVDAAQAPFTTTTHHVPRTSRAPSPSSDPCVRNTSPHGRSIIPASAIPLSPSPVQPSAETIELHRELTALNAERDMYRTRAYELAMRLDGCYTVHAQTTYTLERAERELATAREALRQCETERRDLAVALALAMTATRAGSPGSGSPAAALAAQASFPADPTSLVQPLPSSEELVVYLRDHPALLPAAKADADATGKTYTSTREAQSSFSTIQDHDDRPLLLPPAADATEGEGAGRAEDSPARSRMVHWAPPAERPKPALEELVLETQRRADFGRAMKKGPSGLWDAQRAASTKARFSVLHEDAECDRRARGDAHLSPELPAQVEGNRIIEDLRLSRPRTSPPESPELYAETGSKSRVADTELEVQVQVQVERPSGILETVPEVGSSEELEDEYADEQEEGDFTDDSGECYEDCEDELESSLDHAPQGGVKILLNKPHGPTTPCQAKEPKEPTLLQVPITRQPFGPPPSPNASVAEKKAAQRSREHTWRGRSSNADTEALTPSPASAYPESRMPNRVRTRQATAPPAPMGPDTTPSSRSTQPEVATAKLCIASSGTRTTGDERKRHATFSAGGGSSTGTDNSNSNEGASPSPSSPTSSATHASTLPSAAGTPGTRWQLSALGNGAGEKLRAPARAACFPFAPSSALYATVKAGTGEGKA